MADNLNQVLRAAIADLAEHGYDNVQRVNMWMERIKNAAKASLVPEADLDAMLRRSLGSVYRRLIDRGELLNKHPGVPRFTLERVKPKLRDELERRIMASANLIKLNRSAAIERTLQRFSGWASSVPVGGTKAVDKRETNADIRRAMGSLPFEDRRVIIDQGHKFTSALSEILASDGGAIAGIWHSHWRQRGYNYREDHKERDGEMYAVRGNWALKAGLMKADIGYIDDITKPGEEVFCRCVLGSTQVALASGISIVSRRQYDGPSVKLITRSHPELPLVLTPNHPVLTLNGWQPAHSLNVGDDLIELRDQNVASSVGINNIDDGIPTIEQIFRAAEQSGTAQSIRSSGIQFHGDGADGDVDIVRPASALYIDFVSSRPQSGGELSFTIANRARAVFSESYSVLKGLLATANGLLGALYRFVGKSLAFRFGISLPMSFLGRADMFGMVDALTLGVIVPYQDSGFGLGSYLDATFAKATPNGGVGDFELLCKKHCIDPALIQTTKLVKIERGTISAHVYNLQTKNGWYATNGILSHNCYYTFKYNLRDLPPEMLTAKGRAELQRVRVAA